MVLVVLDEELLDVFQDHRQLVGLLLLVQSETEQRLGIDRQVRAVAVEELQHVGVRVVGIDEDHVDECVERVGVYLPRVRLGSEVLQPLNLIRLMSLEPIDTPFQHARHDGDVVLASDL